MQTAIVTGTILIEAAVGICTSHRHEDLDGELKALEASN